MIQFDVSTAFLNGNLEEDIYLNPPDGIACDEDEVLKLNKSIYGLKQSPRCWKITFDKILESCNLKPTFSDPCLYTGYSEDARVYLVVYVDDGIIASQTLENLINSISKEVQIRIVENNCCIGMEIERPRPGEIYIHQYHYIQKMLAAYNLENCIPMDTPMGDFRHLMETDVNDKPTMALYREIIGNLNFSVFICRPDIAFAVRLLGKFCNHPMEKDWTGAKRT